MGSIVGSNRGSAYLGVGAQRPRDWHEAARDPNQYDNGPQYNIGDEWINTVTRVIWQLISLQGNATSAGALADWVKANGNSGTVVSLTGDIGGAVLPDGSGNINVIAGVSVDNCGSSVEFTGSGNTLKLNVTDSFSNTLIGKNAGNSFFTGQDCVGLGVSALQDMVGGGHQNVALGNFALQSLTGGSQCVAVGFGAGSNYSADESNNIILGPSLGTPGSDGEMWLGDFTNTIHTNVAGVYGVTPAGTNEIVSTNSVNGQLGSFSLADATTGRALPQSGILRIQGDGTTATTVATGNTITITSIGGGGGGTITGLEADDTNIATPTAGIIVIAGGSGIATTATSGPNTVTISATGTVFFHYTNVNTSPYVVLSTDQYLSVDCSSIAITLQFPNAATLGRAYVVKDRTGSAATNNITVTTVSGTDLIDGVTSFVMNTAYESVDIIGNGTGFEVF